jgi:hypothetical protein
MTLQIRTDSTQQRETTIPTVGDIATIDNLTLEKNKNEFLGTSLKFKKSRRTDDKLSSIVSGDELSSINFLGYDGLSYSLGSRIQVTSRGTIVEGRVPSTMKFSVANSVGNSSELLRLDTEDSFLSLTGISDSTTLLLKNSHNLNNPARLVMTRSRGTNIFPEDVEPGDRVFDMVSSAFANGVARSTTLISTEVETVVGSVVQSSINFFTADKFGALRPVVSVTPAGELKVNTIRSFSSNESLNLDANGIGTINAQKPLRTNGYVKLPVYNNDTQRDNDISEPEPGMIIFNQQNDSTGVPQFQGFDGINWVNLRQ